jgi:urease accessory protein
MALGALLAHGGLGAAAGPAAKLLEPALAASVVLLGALLAGGARVAPRIGLALIGAAAVLHGAAHGLELAVGGSALAFGGGFLLTTAVLHGAGLLAGAALRRGAATVRRSAGAAVGFAFGAAGLLLLAARI